MKSGLKVGFILMVVCPPRTQAQWLFDRKSDPMIYLTNWMILDYLRKCIHESWVLTTISGADTQWATTAANLAEGSNFRG